MTQVILAIGIVVGLMVAWVGVQYLWKEAFSEYVADDDAMAGRTKCANCACTTACKKLPSEGSGVGSKRVSPAQTDN